MVIFRSLKISFYYIALFIVSGCVFATDELIDFKVNQSTLISQNNIKVISEFGEKVTNIVGHPQVRIEMLLSHMKTKNISKDWLNWFVKTYGTSGVIGYKKFAAAIFYPYEILATTHKQHLQQMNYAFKACVMYSSDLDNRGVARIMLRSLGTDIGFDISSDNNLLYLLDISLITTSSSFLDKIKLYVNSHYNILDRLKGEILTRGTTIQALNLGLVFKGLGRDDDALECFDIAINKGSFRASIEMGNILLKRDFDQGASFFSSLGGYGIWKIAQCYRYGINTERRMDEANRFYLEALSTHEARYYPEICYDAADFAVYYAYSQSNFDVFKAVIDGAIKQFVEAGKLHLGLGYLRAAELSLDVVNLFSDMATDSNFSVNFRKEAAKRALLEGQAAKATSMLDKLHLGDDADMVVIRACVEQIDRYFGF